MKTQDGMPSTAALAAYLRRHNLKLPAIAEIAGIKYLALWRTVTGRTTPRDKIVTAICEVTGIPVDQFQADCFDARSLRNPQSLSSRPDQDKYESAS